MPKRKRPDRRGRHHRPGSGGGRTTPKGTRPRHLRAVPSGTPGDPCDGSEHPADEILRTGGDDLLAGGDALAAEVWASHLLALFDGIRSEARLAREEVPPFETMVLDRARVLRTPGSLAAATALAAVAPEPLAGRARRVVEALRAGGVGGPAWLDAVGTARFTEAWLATDVYGDQDVVILAVAHDDNDGRRALVTLVDRNLSGQAKDAWIGDSAREVADTWRANGDEHLSVAPIGVEEACARVRSAMAQSDLWSGDTGLRSEDHRGNRALVWSWLARAGHHDGGVAHEEPMARAERDLLVGAFVAEASGRDGPTTGAGLPQGVDVELIAGHLVDLRADYGDDPLRWSPLVAETVLLDLVPRKLVLRPVDAAAVPAVARAWVRFAGRRTGLDARWVDETVAAVDEMESEYLDRVSDPSAGGPAKQVVEHLLRQGVELDDGDAVRVAIDRLNDSGGLDAVGDHRSRRRPGRTPRDVAPEVVGSAAEAVVPACFDALADFYGPGRKLTAKGNPTLADARTLVGLLDLADEIDAEIRGRTFRTRSAEELPELMFDLRWALEAGVLRKHHGKLVGTASWAKLAGRPVERFSRAADAMVALGPLATRFSRARPGFRALPEAVDEVLPLVLGRLALGGMEAEAVIDRVDRVLDERYEWRGYLADPAHRRDSIGRDVELLLAILGRAGVVARAGAEQVPDDFTGRPRPHGGTVRLTPAGAWWWDRFPG